MMREVRIGKILGRVHAPSRRSGSNHVLAIRIYLPEAAMRGLVYLAHLHLRRLH